MTINSKKEFGLFVIPIRFNKSKSVYSEYLEYIISLEGHGYDYVFIGEHLTDSHEDIQSSIVFAAALLARTKTLKVALSVLPLTYYHIPLLVKQLEDLYQLSQGRLLIGFSPGALDSDMLYLGLNPASRYPIFCNKLSEFQSLIKKSLVLSSIPNSHFFSTLLSEKPINSSKLFDQGFSALSSNFIHSSHLNSHWECLTSNASDIETASNWHVAFNIIPEFMEISLSSRRIIIQTLTYIFNKLNKKASNIMFPDNISINSDSPPKNFDELLIKHQTQTLKQARKLTPSNSNIVVCNLFDCLEDSIYNEFILSLPAQW